MRFNKKELAQYSSSGFDFEGRLNYRTAGGNFTQPGKAYFSLYEASINIYETY
jgi:hypothetical protein